MALSVMLTRLHRQTSRTRLLTPCPAPGATVYTGHMVASCYSWQAALTVVHHSIGSFLTTDPTVAMLTKET